MWPALNNGLTNWDDNSYVSENQHIQQFDFDTLKSIFVGDAKFYMGNYHPLTMLSLAADYQISGTTPRQLHLTNLVLHLANTVLVFWLIYLLCHNLTLAGIAGLLFGVHGLHVESVVWISERKDVLYSMFFLSSLLAYLRYLAKGERKFYWGALLLFLLSLLSKGQAVSLAVTLLAIDLLQGRKIASRAVLLEKIPFFVLALAFGVIAIVAQQSLGAIADGSAYSLSERLLFACYGFVQYVVKLVLPLKLSAIYPYPARIDGGIPLQFWFYPVPVVALLVGFVQAVRRAPMVAFAIAFFVVNIFLVLQLLPVGNAIMADRYAYIPSIGFFLLVALAFDKLSHGERQWVFRSGLAVYVVVLMALTQQQSRVWQSSMTLWNDVISKCPTAVSAWNNRGALRRQANDFKGAIADYNRAITLNPLHAKAFNNRGACKFNLKNYKGAIADYDRAIELNPDYTKAYRNRSNARFYLGSYSDATADLDSVLARHPQDANALFNRAVNHLKLARHDRAISDFDALLRVQPWHRRAYFYRALSRQARADFRGAIDDYDHAIELSPKAGDLYFKRGLAKVRTGELTSACDDFHTAEDFGYQKARQEIERHCNRLAGQIDGGHDFRLSGE